MANMLLLNKLGVNKDQPPSQQQQPKPQETDILQQLLGQFDANSLAMLSQMDAKQLAGLGLDETSVNLISQALKQNNVAQMISQKTQQQNNELQAAMSLAMLGGSMGMMNVEKTPEVQQRKRGRPKKDAAKIQQRDLAQQQNNAMNSLMTQVMLQQNNPLMQQLGGIQNQEALLAQALLASNNQVDPKMLELLMQAEKEAQKLQQVAQKSTIQSNTNTPTEEVQNIDSLRVPDEKQQPDQSNEKRSSLSPGALVIREDEQTQPPASEAIENTE